VRAMTALAHAIAVVIVLLAGIHPSVDEPDPSWITGFYDDSDGDGLVASLSTDTDSRANVDAALGVVLERFGLLCCSSATPTLTSDQSRSRVPRLEARSPPLAGRTPAMGPAHDSTRQITRTARISASAEPAGV